MHGQWETRHKEIWKYGSETFADGEGWRGWSKKESGDLQIEKCWRSGVEKASRRALGGKRMGVCGG